jgi:hypothetical protein
MDTNRQMALYHTVILLCASVLAGGLFSFLYLHFTSQSVVDTDGFAALGKHLATYGDFGGSIRRGPIYPFFLGAIYRVLGQGDPAFIFAQSLLLGILAIIVYNICFRISRSHRSALITGLCVALYPACLWYVPRIWVELLFAILILLMTWSAHKALSTASTPSFITFGIATAVASLCKAVALLFPLFLACFVVILQIFKIFPYGRFSGRLIVRLLIIPTASMMIIIMPWTLRNHAVSDTWTLVSSSVGVEFYRGNVFAEYNSYIVNTTVPKIWDIASKKEAHLIASNGLSNANDKHVEQFFNTLMIDFIVRHPFEFALKVAKQIPAFWIRGETAGKSLAFLVMALITWLAFFKAFASVRRLSPFPYVVLGLALYLNLLYAAILAWARYSMPLYAPLLIVAVYPFTCSRPQPLADMQMH